MATVIKTDVLIIGTGPAGLTAAYDLITMGAGLDVTILEASNKIGGRMQADTTLTNFPVELGAEWIQTEDLSILDTIAGQGVLQELLNENKIVEDTIGSYYDFEAGQFYESNLNTVNGYKFVDYSWNQFFTEYLYPTIQDDGATNIVFDCEVNLVDSRRTRTKVKCKNRSDIIYKAKKVIVAVPLSIMKDGDIRFLPELSTEKKTALANVKITPGIKAFLKFTEKFFYNDFGYENDTNNNQNNERYFYDAGEHQSHNILDDENIVGLFAVGSDATDYIGKSDTEIANLIISQLDEMYDGDASRTFTNEYVVQNWVTEPHIRGAYANYYGGNYRYLRKLAKSIGSKVYFAGGYVPVDWEDEYVHTAAISGKAAAYQIMNGNQNAYDLCIQFDGIDC